MFSIEVISFLAGVLLLFVGLIGGGFKIKEIEMPRVSAVFRILSTVVGFFFILIGIGVRYDNKNNPERQEIPTNNFVQQSLIATSTSRPECVVWNLIWTCNDVEYEALLIFKPKKGIGKMRVKYNNEGGNVMIEEEISQVSTDEGQYLKGSNPYDTETFQPITSYVPDNLIMNNQTVHVFDVNGTYKTQMVAIDNVDAIVRSFGFRNEDLNF